MTDHHYTDRMADQLGIDRGKFWEASGAEDPGEFDEMLAAGLRKIVDDQKGPKWTTTR
jgi:hypothetical protein